MKILFCGDYIPYSGMTHKDEKIFGDFYEVIKEANFSFFNQEHPVTKSDTIYNTKKHGVTDNCHPDLLNPVIRAGFTHATLATNHILNRGIEGIKDTVDFFNSNGIGTIGAGSNLKEARKILYLNANGIRISILNFAENEYNSANNYHGGSNPLSIIDNVKDIKVARENSDYVFVIIHGGLEYCIYPTERMVVQYRYYAENGASAIISHHSHVVAAYEVYNDVPIFYGIGNLISAKPVKKFRSDSNAKYNMPVLFEINDSRMDFQRFPLRYDFKQDKLVVLQDLELSKFESIISEASSCLHEPTSLNKIIAERFLNDEILTYYYTLFTRSNYFLFKLARKFGLIKIYNFLMVKRMKLNKKNTSTWNIMRCETHQDIYSIIYNELIDNYRQND